MEVQQYVDNEDNYLYHTASAHPVTEYIPTNVEDFSQTPSFILTVTWPRIVQFYHPASTVCQELVDSFVGLAREIRRRSPRIPVEFHAVSCAVHTTLCEDLEIRNVPHILSYLMGSIDGSVLQRQADNTFDIDYVANRIRISLKEDERGGIGGGGGASGGGGTLINNGAVTKKHVPNLPQIYADINFFVLDLMGRITRESYSLSSHRKRVLQEWFDLLHWTLPSKDFSGLHNLVKDLRQNMDIIYQNPPYLSELVMHAEPLLPVALHSVDCDNVCAFWKLTHVVSIGMVAQHTYVLGDLDRITVKHALDTLLDTALEFGLDPEQHFQTMFTECHAEPNCATELKDSKGFTFLALWLWEVHNRIERYGGRKMWPLPVDCPRCYDPGSNEEFWNKQAVFDYLSNEYWPKGMQTPRLVVLDTTTTTTTNKNRPFGTILIGYRFLRHVPMVFVLLAMMLLCLVVVYTTDQRRRFHKRRMRNNKGARYARTKKNNWSRFYVDD